MILCTSYIRVILYIGCSIFLKICDFEKNDFMYRVIWLRACIFTYTCFLCDLIDGWLVYGGLSFCNDVFLPPPG